MSLSFSRLSFLSNSLSHLFASTISSRSYSQLFPKPDAAVLQISSLLHNREPMKFRGIKPMILTLNSRRSVGKILETGRHPDPMEMGILVECLCHDGRVKEALRFHDHMKAKGFQMNNVNYGILIDGLCKLGETRAAIQLLRKIEVSKLDAGMYHTIIDNLCWDNLIDDACRLYSEMIAKRFCPTVVAYNVMIQGFCIAGQLREATHMFNEMALKNINPNVHTFDVLIDGFRKEGKVEEGGGILALMVKACVRPSAVTYNSVKLGYCLTRRVKYQKYMAGSGLTPDNRNYADEDMNLFEEMHTKGMVANTETYISLVDAARKSGKFSYAEELLEEMRERGQPTITIAYNSMIHVLRKKLDIDRVIALFKGFVYQKVKIQPDAYTPTIPIDELCKNRRLKHARKCFQDLLVESYHLNVPTYNAMIDGFCTEDLSDEALVLLTKMEDNGYFPNAITFEIIIRALFGKDENDKAEKLVREMIARDLL